MPWAIQYLHTIKKLIQMLKIIKTVGTYIVSLFAIIMVTILLEDHLIESGVDFQDHYFNLFWLKLAKYLIFFGVGFILIFFLRKKLLETKSQKISALVMAIFAAAITGDDLFNSSNPTIYAPIINGQDYIHDQSFREEAKFFATIKNQGNDSLCSLAYEKLDQHHELLAETRGKGSFYASETDFDYYITIEDAKFFSKIDPSSIIRILKEKELTKYCTDQLGAKAAEAFYAALKSSNKQEELELLETGLKNLKAVEIISPNSEEQKEVAEAISKIKLLIIEKKLINPLEGEIRYEIKLPPELRQRLLK